MFSLTVDFLLGHSVLLLMRAFLKVLIFIKTVLCILIVILKYVIYKCLRMYHSDYFDQKYDGKLAYNKNFFSLSICAAACIYGLSIRHVLQTTKSSTCGKPKFCQLHIASKMMSASSMLIEFSLDMIQLTLKCGKPFVEPKLNDVRVSTIALKCISTVISRHMSLELLDAALSVFGYIFFLPMQNVLKSIVNIFWNNHQKK